MSATSPSATVYDEPQQLEGNGSNWQRPRRTSQAVRGTHRRAMSFQSPANLRAAATALETLEELGKGIDGVVYKVRDRTTGRVVVRKDLERRIMSSTKLIQELDEMYAKIDSKSIVKVYGAYMNEFDQVSLIMEYCEGRSLRDVMNQIGSLGAVVSESVAAKLSLGIFEALAYLEAVNIVHMNLRASNILITNQGAVKLTDIAFSASLSGAWTSTLDHSCLPPEVITATSKSSHKSETWRAATIIYELATRRPIWPSDCDSVLDLMTFIVQNEPPKLEDEESGIKWSGNMKGFLDQGLEKDHNKRPSPTTALQHPWLIQSANKKVPMHRWIREVWNWPAPSRRPSVASELSAQPLTQTQTLGD